MEERKMFEKISVNSIMVSEFGGFQNSKLQHFEYEYFLSHFVRMSQKKGEWITECTLAEFMKDFDPVPILIYDEADFARLLKELVELGYIKINVHNRTIKVTKKFENFCFDYLRGK